MLGKVIKYLLDSDILKSAYGRKFILQSKKTVTNSS
jgi:hypothetical protein